ncbi:MAG TPA: glycoside hydrolase family 6 protein [Polyangia bacterium]|nr:glycoside hydrolase family 6 protein [Polyangia bacterium]
MWILLASSAAAAAPPEARQSARGLAPETRFYVPPPDSGANEQVADLLRSRRRADARRLAALVATPQAVWFTSGSPQEVEAAVRRTTRSAALERRVPVLVAYNIPFRDCGNLSAGGAADAAAYRDWIDGFARGVGDGKAVVILEPDSLGIIPFNTTIYGAADSCQPTVTDGQGKVVPAPGASPTERYAQLNYAVDSLEAKAPRASVYLDGTHSAWLGVGEAAYRLVTAGVRRAQGFFLNVSNFQPTDQLAQFGTWVSDCITAATAGPSGAAGHFDWCPSQYNPATNYTLDFSPEFAATVTAALLKMMGGATATTRFVLDTSRNGQGPWTPAAAYPDAQNWCNPPRRGAGRRPTADPRHTAGRRRAVDQDTGRVGRLLHARHRRREHRSRMGRHRRPGCGRLVPAAGGAVGHPGPASALARGAT